MRIVVSGTHASGKSTLVSDFRLAHPHYATLGDPFDELDDDAFVLPGPRLFLAQLRISAMRLSEDGSRDLIVERGPIDFLAYLAAWQELGRGEIADELWSRCVQLAAQAMREVDLLVLLRTPDVYVPQEEDPELRDAMQDVLGELADDSEFTGGARVVPLDGSPAERVAGLQVAMR